MSTLKIIILITSVFALFGSAAQEISIEEMQLLDKFRAQYQEKNIQLKAEDEIRLLQRLRAMKEFSAAANKGGFPPAQMLSQPIIQQQPATIAAQAAVNSLPSEIELRNKLDSLAPGKQLNSFLLLRDGLTFNGQRFADPEGIAKNFAIDPESSTVAYLVSINTAASVKIARLGTNSEPLTIGKLTQDANRQVFQSATGKTLSGDLFFPLTDGVLLVRDSVGFRYVVGEGIKQINFPTGWGPAPLQRGNTSTTSWFLLEKDTTEEKKNPLNSILALGELVGAVAARMDYALFNLNDLRMVPFEISSGGKTVVSYSQCRRMSNGLFNKCDQMRTYDSVWNPDGSPNRSHYFWKIDWQKMDGTSVAVVMESGLQQINAYDLTGAKKVNLFERTLGINHWSMTLTDNGKYRANAQLAFENAEISDVAQELKNRPEVPSKH